MKKRNKKARPPPRELRSHSPRVLVLGGAGFIGRNAAQALAHSGFNPIIGSRHPHKAEKRLPEELRPNERRQIRLERCLKASDWAPHLNNVDAVVNCVGILRQRGRETYQRVHHLAPGALAKACREKQLPLVHISALGLRENARSRFISSKWHGEQAVQASGANSYLVRPSLLDGEGGYGSKWIRRVANWAVRCIPASAKGRIAALAVDELGEAIAALVRHALSPNRNNIPRVIELGGPDRHSLGQYLNAMRSADLPSPQREIRCPALIARCVAHLFDVLHLTPYSFGHYELLTRDNVPTVNHLHLLLGRAPTRIRSNPCAPQAGVRPIPLSKI